MRAGLWWGQEEGKNVAKKHFKKKVIVLKADSYYSLTCSKVHLGTQTMQLGLVFFNRLNAFKEV